MKNVILALTLLALSACSPSVNVDGTGIVPQKATMEYSTEPAHGYMNNVSWTFISGTAKPDFSDPNRLSITLNNEDFAEPCSAFNFAQASILTSVPNGTGEIYFGQGNPIETATFSYRDQGGSINLFITEGRMKITSITAEEVTGSILADYNSGNSINGTFKLKICPR